MDFKHIITKAGGQAADKISKLSSLSPEQLQQIQAQRDAYLSQMPAPDDPTAEELTKRLLAACSVDIYRAYLAQLKELYLPIDHQAEYGIPFDAARNIRFFNITKWVVDKQENSLEKLVNVYEVLSSEACNISLVFHRTCEQTNVFLAVTNTQNANNNVDVENFRIRLGEAIKGNFPGSEWAPEIGSGILPCMKNDRPYSVALASNLPTEKSRKFISQTIEKLLDGIVPDQRSKEYILILLATPIRDVESRKLRLAEMYSALSPYACWSTTYTYNEQNTSGSSATVNINIGASAGIQNGQNQGTTTTTGRTDSTSDTATNSIAETQTESSGETVTDSSGSSVTSTAGSTASSSATHTYGSSTSQTSTTGYDTSASVSGGANTGIDVNAGFSRRWSSSTADGTGTNVSDALTRGITESVSQGITQSAGQSIARAAGTTVSSAVSQAVAKTLGQAVSNSASLAASAFKSVNLGVNFGVGFARSSHVTAAIGKSEGISQTFLNYNIKHALELLENQMKRLDQSSALGMWDFAAYVMSEDLNVASNVAHSYLALTQGEGSYLSQPAVHLWRGDMGQDSGDAQEICSYLRELRHPVFGLNPSKTADDPRFQVYPPIVTATTSLSGKELAYSLNFPRKSISGLPVIECAEFGRNVVSYDPVPLQQKQFELGNIFHMNHAEAAKVHLAKNSLTSHTFITGSTGSGKSNTIYLLLQEALEQGIHFMVVEPAKGEYKHIFGSDPDVAVYGTNPSVSPLLRLNPFSFPSGIHVLEHLDRLVEIFNVCWPMYAAMPAVLKSAVEKSYQDCGWDLVCSVNRYDAELYPSFADVARNIRELIDSSEYDAENKGAYKGSLLTRLQSLTTGVNGIVFTNDALPDAELFDQNVIVDLSRVGSSETKSLLMGMLVLKLQEYRLSNASGINQPLHHITVLEEAHHLLKRTSTEQFSESSNLLGNSVEMLANAIAEMRTYGEGFIIADQSPGLLDLSVIRNTNTKIILRLPDQADRELVGHAANLNDDQITELAKLPRGVAAIYHNEWVQPVLCKVSRYTGPQTYYHYTPKSPDPYLDAESGQMKDSLLDCIMNQELLGKGNRAALLRLKQLVLRSKLNTSIKRDFMEYLSSADAESVKALGQLVYDFLSAKPAIQAAARCSDLSEWVQTVMEGLNPSIKGYSQKQINLALALILQEQALRDASYHNLLIRFVEVYQTKGGVL